MSSSNLPMLADNVATQGIVFTRTEADIAGSIDEKALGFACIELIGKLENEFARAKDFQATDYVDEAASTARKMLEPLKAFSDEFLTGDAKMQANEEISKAQAVGDTYDEVLKTRPLGNALLRTFWKADEVEAIRDAHAKLGESLIRATAAALYHGIMLLGFDTPMGQEIDQSTVVFVTELNQSWSYAS